MAVFIGMAKRTTEQFVSLLLAGEDCPYSRKSYGKNAHFRKRGMALPQVGASWVPPSIS